MSKEHTPLPPTEDREPDSDGLTPEIVRNAFILMSAFGWLTFLVVLLAGTLFLGAFSVPNPQTPGTLWRLAFLGTLSCLFTAKTHHWIKTHES